MADVTVMLLVSSQVRLEIAALMLALLIGVPLGMVSGYLSDGVDRRLVLLMAPLHPAGAVAIGSPRLPAGACPAQCGGCPLCGLCASVLLGGAQPIGLMKTELYIQAG